MTGFGVEGLTNLTAQMRERLLNLPRRSGVKAISAGAKVIKDQARALAPVNKGKGRKGRRRGTLKRSIIFKFAKGAAGIIRAKLIVRDPLGHLHELGYKTKLGRTFRKFKLVAKRPRKNKVRGRIARVSGKFFMRRAIDSSSGRAVDRIVEVVTKELNK